MSRNPAARRWRTLLSAPRVFQFGVLIPGKGDCEWFRHPRIVAHYFALPSSNCMANYVTMIFLYVIYMYSARVYCTFYNVKFAYT